MNAVAVFVDAARLYNLGSGIDEVRTEARLARCGTALGIPGHEVEAWVAAFHAVQRYRLRRQARCLAANVAPDNRLDPETLNDFDRQVLRSALEQVRTLQKRLALDHDVAV